MSSTTLPHAPGEFGEPPARPAARAARGPAYYLRRGLKAVASLQLTVVLFALGVVLVFFGTLAQLDNGIWTIVDQYFYSTVVWVPFELTHRFLGVFWKEQFPAGESAWVGSFPLPGGFLLGTVMLLNLLAAHATRFRLSWKRAGIFFIHGGIVLLFVGEFITREYAVEQQMTIPEGGSANYAEDTRNAELAFVDRSAPDADRVTVITQKRLAAAKPGQRISHPDLPVDVEVLEFMKNADFKNPGPGVKNPATAGAGLQMVAVWRKEEPGVEMKQRGDFTSTYVRLYKKGTDDALGVHLGSLVLSLDNQSDPVAVDGKTYQMTLRRARIYKPYTVHLDKFRFDRYEGTANAKNYSSDVRVKDADGTEVRNQRIAMNEPLRYSGETFYQSSFDRAETMTILQVVKNPGLFNFYLFYATIDYIACALVGFGLVLHFGIYLVQFLRRKQSPLVAAATAAPVPADGATLSRIFPWVMLGLAALVLLSAFGRMSPRALREPYDMDAFARTPVLEGGRVKPIETVARVYMRVISHRETFVDQNGDTQPAIRWYLDLLAAESPSDGSDAWKHKVFRIENDQVRAELKLDSREGFRYSLDEIKPRLSELFLKAAAAGEKIDAKKPVDLAESKMIELAERITMVIDINRPKARKMQNKEKDTLRQLPPNGDTSWGSLPEFREKQKQDAQLVGVTAAYQALQSNPKRLFSLTDAQKRKLVRILERVELEKLPEAEQTEALVDAVTALRRSPAEVPPMARNIWLDAACAALTPEEAAHVRGVVVTEYQTRLDATPAARDWEKMIAAYRDQKPAEFNAAVAEYRGADLSGVSRGKLLRTRLEVMYNRFAPFYQCTGLYVLGFLLALAGFVLYVAESPVWAVALRKSATYVLLLTLLVHTVALFTRMYLMERPGVFVTNLYSSAVFIGWGCVALCLVLERIFPIGIGNVVASVLGLATTIVAHNLGTLDTLEMMEAVLDTNFWLATHVTTVTLGYTATFVAGFLGALYVFMMLGAVVRESYLSTGEPTVGGLLAFGAAAVGVVGIPLAFLAFMTTALDKFEVLPSLVLWGLFYLTLAAGVMYSLALMLLRVSVAGADEGARPLAGQVPAIAKPIVALALTPESGKIVGQMVYGVVCFATMLSFIGTVLGGIWADQSWGRFWGWDPKENGAVLIVLWNCLILHARWAGLVKDRGVAVLAVFGNAITAWSWFGTNQLGIGLHAYGFDSRLADGCFNFWLSQMFILALGAAIPRRFWASRGGAAAAVPVTPTGPLSDASAPPPNGPTNGHPRRDKGKRPGKRR